MARACAVYGEPDENCLSCYKTDCFAGVFSVGNQ